MPFEYMVYRYRLQFHLSAADMANEPVDQFFTNRFIYNLIQERQQDELRLKELSQKHGQQSS